MASKFDMAVQPKASDYWKFDLNEIVVDHEFNGRYEQRTEAEIRELMESIVDSPIGQETPGLVKRIPGSGKMFLVAGFGRYDAIALYNSEHPETPMPFKAIILDGKLQGNELDAFNSSVRENCDRKELTYMDKAKIVTRYTNKYNKTDAEIAQMLHFKSVSSVGQYRSLMRLSEENRAKVHHGELTLSNALLLVGQTEEEQKAIVESSTTETGKIDASKVRDKVREIREKKSKPETKAPLTDDERVDEAIAKGEVPPKGTGQSGPSYRREVLNMLNYEAEEDAKLAAKKAGQKTEKHLERTMKDVKRYFGDLSNMDLGVFLFSSALLRWISGDLNDDQCYRALEEAAAANSKKSSKAGV